MEQVFVPSLYLYMFKSECNMKTDVDVLDAAAAAAATTELEVAGSTHMVVRLPGVAG